MKIWIINGYTADIGQWELEIFTKEEDAVNAFKDYVNDMKADEEEDSLFAFLDDGQFWVEEHDIDLNS